MRNENDNGTCFRSKNSLDLALHGLSPRCPTDSQFGHFNTFRARLIYDSPSQGYDGSYLGSYQSLSDRTTGRTNCFSEFYIQSYLGSYQLKCPTDAGSSLVNDRPPGSPQQTKTIFLFMWSGEYDMIVPMTKSLLCLCQKLFIYVKTIYFGSSSHSFSSSLCSLTLLSRTSVTVLGGSVPGLSNLSNAS